MRPCFEPATFPHDDFAAHLDALVQVAEAVHLRVHRAPAVGGPALAPVAPPAEVCEPSTLTHPVPD